MIIGFFLPVGGGGREGSAEDVFDLPIIDRLNES
jgi:hypothetical protein